MSSKEYPRAFDEFLRDVGEGAALQELTKQLHRLNIAIATEAKAQQKEVGGALTVKFAFKSDGAVTAVAYEITTKEPAPRRPGSVFFNTRGGNLSVDNQRQTSLPLREVEAAVHSARDIFPSDRDLSDEIAEGSYQ